MRISVITAVACLLTIGLAVAEEADAAIRKPTNISAQGLVAALNALAKDRDIQVVYRSEIVGALQTSGAEGELTQEEALKQLLSGTSLTYRYLDDRTVTIEPVPSGGKVTLPEVTGKQPAAISNQKDSASTVREIVRLESMAGTAPRSFWQRLRLAQAEEQKRSSDAATESADEKVELEEIVVSAQKREESLSDVPISISVRSGAQLEAARIGNLLDLSFSVPGLSVAETGPGRQIIVIRGLGSERGSSSLTGVYLDEMPVTGAQDGFIQSYIDLRTIDLDRAEVLKGPQGTLFGEGSVGGTVRFITKGL